MPLLRPILRGRADRGEVPGRLVGVSAGAIMLASQWVRWRDPDDDATAEVFDCLGFAKVLCDAHGEEDGWAELRALLRLKGKRAVGYGIRTGAAIAVSPAGRVEVVMGAIDRLSG